MLLNFGECKRLHTGHGQLFSISYPVAFSGARPRKDVSASRNLVNVNSSMGNMDLRNAHVL